MQDYLSSLLSKLALSRGKAGVSAAEMILTAGADWFNASYPGWKENADLLKEWVDANLRFLDEKFGDMRVSAVLHLDEDAPHFHVLIIPKAFTSYGKRKDGSSKGGY